MNSLTNGRWEYIIAGHNCIIDTVISVIEVNYPSGNKALRQYTEPIKTSDIEKLKAELIMAQGIK